MTVEELEKEALRLKAIEKIHLIEKILESLDKPDPEIEKEWVAESEARYKAYKDGAAQTVSLDEIKKKHGK